MTPQNRILADARSLAAAVKLAGCAALSVVLLMTGCGRDERERSLNRKAVESQRSAKTPAATKMDAPVEPAPKAAVVDRALELESREARIASMRLAEEVADLRSQIEKARTKIKQLTEALAKAQENLDRRQRDESVAAMQADTTGAAGQAVTRGEFQLLDVNEDLNLVVLDAGSADGITPGMQFSIAREKKVIGRVRVVDVRDKITGAVLEDARSGNYPRKGDKAVLWSGD